MQYPQALARTCRLGRGPRTRLNDAASHKRLGARLRAAAIERSDELFVHLSCLFVQALRGAATSTPACRCQSSRAERAFFLASSASLCSCGAARERCTLRAQAIARLKRVFLGPDRSEQVLLVHSEVRQPGRKQTLGVDAKFRRLRLAEHRCGKWKHASDAGCACRTPPGAREP